MFFLHTIFISFRYHIISDMLFLLLTLLVLFVIVLYSLCNLRLFSSFYFRMYIYLFSLCLRQHNRMCYLRCREYVSAWELKITEKQKQKNKIKPNKIITKYRYAVQLTTKRFSSEHEVYSIFGILESYKSHLIYVSF